MWLVDRANTQKTAATKDIKSAQQLLRLDHSFFSLPMQNPSVSISASMIKTPTKCICASNSFQADQHLNENARHINHKFSVCIEFLESSIILGFITGAEDYNSFTDEQIGLFPSSCSVESKEFVTRNKLGKIIKRLCTNIKNIKTTQRMRDLFGNYYTLWAVLGSSGSSLTTK